MVNSDQLAVVNIIFALTFAAVDGFHHPDCPTNCTLPDRTIEPHPLKSRKPSSPGPLAPKVRTTLNTSAAVFTAAKKPKILTDAKRQTQTPGTTEDLPEKHARRWAGARAQARFASDDFDSFAFGSSCRNGREPRSCS